MRAREVSATKRKEDIDINISFNHNNNASHLAPQTIRIVNRVRETGYLELMLFEKLEVGARG
jgi:hypothetical protein